MDLHSEETNHFLKRIRQEEDEIEENVLFGKLKISTLVKIMHGLDLFFLVFAVIMAVVTGNEEGALFAFWMIFLLPICLPRLVFTLIVVLDSKNENKVFRYLWCKTITFVLFCLLYVSTLLYIIFLPEDEETPTKMWRADDFFAFGIPFAIFIALDVYLNKNLKNYNDFVQNFHVRLSTRGSTRKF